MLLKLCIYLSLALIFLFTYPKTTFAITDPLSVPNNKFGIHILDTIDLDLARELVNSSGGDWGYVTLVIRQNERDLQRWQEVFDNMRRYHLIPIVRLATDQSGMGWEKFNEDDIDSWVFFLNSLNWVTENRYVIIGNEPNHATEWGGEINPSEYTNILKIFSEKLKNASDDFFILQAGFDASAPNTKNTMKEEDYMRKMVAYDNNIFSYIDGWTSHSYPNPDFSASENNTGKGSVRTYLWEIDLLKSLGFTKDYPIFITETGWVHDANGSQKNQDEKQLVTKYTKAYNYAWNNDKVVAVTPFVLSYKDEPFDVFSWIDNEGKPYSFFYNVKNFPKIAGNPKQVNDGEIKFLILPKFIKENSKLYGVAHVTNKGQSIWENNEVYLKSIASKNINIISVIEGNIEPDQSSFIYFSGTSVDGEGPLDLKISLIRNNEFFGNAVNYRIHYFKEILTPIEKIMNLKDTILNWFVGIIKRK